MGHANTLVAKSSDGRNAPCPDFPVFIEERQKVSASQPISKQSMDGSPTMSQDTTKLHCELFIKTVVLEPEQFRTVPPTPTSIYAYTYAPVPVLPSVRHRLSRELFKETEQIPYLTDECALVLRQAQEQNMWDQALAELYAQVLTIIHCPVGDNSLQGLSKYLLSHGIAC